MEEKFEPKNSDELEQSEQKSEESIGERVKLRRKKFDQSNKMITETDETINRDLKIFSISEFI